MNITPAMRRELQSIARWGDPSDPLDYYTSSNLWFRNRDLVLGALVKRGMIEDTEEGWRVTDAGRAAIAKAEGQNV